VIWCTHFARVGGSSLNGATNRTWRHNIKYTRNRRDEPILLNRVHLCYSWFLLSVPAGGGSGPSGRERCMCAIGRLLDDAATCFANWSGFISATGVYSSRRFVNWPSRYLRAAGVDASVACARSEGCWTTPRRASLILLRSSSLLVYTLYLCRACKCTVTKRRRSRMWRRTPASGSRSAALVYGPRPRRTSCPCDSGRTSSAASTCDRAASLGDRAHAPPSVS